MAYSLYFMDGLSRQVTCIEIIDAENDKKATEIAASRHWTGLLELWEENRMVAQFDPFDAPSAA